MTILLITIFFLGYLAIAFEHSLKLNKAATALLTGILCWIVYVYSISDKDLAIEKLFHSFGDISSILFFLLGAMTIVELIDLHDGFGIITKKIKSKSKSQLLFTISIITFFLSSLLDNLTTAIVMTSMLAKLLSNKNDRLWFAGIIVIAANAGGAFSPLGDVTTTMLWIGKQVTAKNIILQLFLPSIAVCLVPTILIASKFKGQIFEIIPSAKSEIEPKDSNIILFSGISLLLFVPVFKSITHLPPFMGVLFALSLLWIIVSILHINKPITEKKSLTVTHALEKIDTPSILFFLGILLAVSALDNFGILASLGNKLSSTFPNHFIVGTILGLVSALVDNVPLVASSQAMYSLKQFPTDHSFWEFLALTTGTGGSTIIIGSAAGIAAMGIENITFGWYLKYISLVALLGFIVGIGIFLLQFYS